MKQQTFSLAGDQNQGFEQYRRPPRRDVFVSMMEHLVPWSALCALIEPYYPKRRNGRPPVGLGRMVRMYFVQQWFSRADEACGGDVARQHGVTPGLSALISVASVYRTERRC